MKATPQQEQVEPHEHGIHGGGTSEQRVVGEPEGADREEAGAVGEVGGPLVGDAAPEVVEVRLGYRDLEHEQGGRDGEHGVAERLDPARLDAMGHGGQFGLHVSCPPGVSFARLSLPRAWM